MKTTTKLKRPGNWISARARQNENYEFGQGFPSEDTIQDAYDDADLTRAVQTYKFFYPTVSGAAIMKGNEAVGLISNQVFGMLDTKPRHVGFTYNSDTPYGMIPLDLSIGPLVVNLPAGPLIVISMDVNQRWVADMGIPGPDEGKGGKHLILPLGYKGEIPAGYHVWNSTTNRLIVGARSLPVGGDVPAAILRLQTIKVYPLNQTSGWKEPVWINITDNPLDTTPVKWETNINFWKTLHAVIDKEPALDAYRIYYGELAVLGIVKGKPFAPDARTIRILENAARIANAQMRVQAFADRRPDRMVWPDRQWEWISLRPENGDFDAKTYVDVDAREVWFFQAIGASPAMTRRKAGQGSLYWLGVKDKAGTYVNGDSTYKLTVPLPVPAKLFWSVTIYDTETRSEIDTSLGKAALRSMFELKEKAEEQSVDLYFGPTAPEGKEEQWIQTIPGKGWFAYFRVYGPESAAFDGTWRPGDFELLK